MVKRYNIESHGMDGQDAVNVESWEDNFSIRDEIFILASDYDASEAKCHELEKRIAIQDSVINVNRIALASSRGRVDQLEEALSKAVDTLDDISRSARLIGKPILAAACDIASAGCRQYMTTTET